MNSIIFFKSFIILLYTTRFRCTSTKLYHNFFLTISKTLHSVNLFNIQSIINYTLFNNKNFLSYLYCVCIRNVGFNRIKTQSLSTQSALPVTRLKFSFQIKIHLLLFFVLDFIISHLLDTYLKCVNIRFIFHNCVYLYVFITSQSQKDFR